MREESRLPKLKNMCDFSKFDPKQANELALVLGKMMGELDDLESADKWYAIAAAIAAGMNPPNATYEGRVSLALRTMAKGIERFADAIDRQTEQHAQNVAAQKARSEAQAKLKQGRGQVQ